MAKKSPKWQNFAQSGHPDFMSDSMVIRKHLSLCQKLKKKADCEAPFKSLVKAKCGNLEIWIFQRSLQNFSFEIIF